MKKTFPVPNKTKIRTVSGDLFKQKMSEKGTNRIKRSYKKQDCVVVCPLSRKGEPKAQEIGRQGEYSKSSHQQETGNWNRTLVLGQDLN